VGALRPLTQGPLTQGPLTQGPLTQAGPAVPKCLVGPDHRALSLVAAAAHESTGPGSGPADSPASPSRSG
jgi:hypothetical protein